MTIRPGSTAIFRPQFPRARVAQVRDAALSRLDGIMLGPAPGATADFAIARAKGQSLCKVDIDRGTNPGILHRSRLRMTRGSGRAEASLPTAAGGSTKTAYSIAVGAQPAPCGAMEGVAALLALIVQPYGAGWLSPEGFGVFDAAALSAGARLAHPLDNFHSDLREQPRPAAPGQLFLFEHRHKQRPLGGADARLGNCAGGRGNNVDHPLRPMQAAP